jgi:uncharacterized protein YjbJ (UPF0337 family)
MGAMDKLKNKAQQLKGTAKQRTGGAMGDRSMEAEGASDNMKGNLKDAGENVKDAFRDK